MLGGLGFSFCIITVVTTPIPVARVMKARPIRSILVTVTFAEQREQNEHLNFPATRVNIAPKHIPMAMNIGLL